MNVEFLARGWQPKLSELLATAEQRLLIAAPYIKYDATSWAVDELTSRGNQLPNETTVLTAISPDSILDASLDIQALLLFADRLQRVTIFDVHRLHAKVYVAYDKQAIITSGNLTSPAFSANFEYGVRLTSPVMVRQVYRDMQGCGRAGREVTRDELVRLNDVSLSLVRRNKREVDQLDTTARKELVAELGKFATASQDHSRLTEAGSARFKDPIMQILGSRGPLATAELCDYIQGAWPELCDDAEIRVSKDGSRKRQWRHDVHTAQETLQRRGLIRRGAAGRWHLV